MEQPQRIMWLMNSHIPRQILLRPLTNKNKEFFRKFFEWRIESEKFYVFCQFLVVGQNICCLLRGWWLVEQIGFVGATVASVEGIICRCCFFVVRKTQTKNTFTVNERMRLDAAIQLTIVDRWEGGQADGHCNMVVVGG